MKTNQKFPGNGSPIPALVLIGLGVALINWLFSGDDTENKPVAAPAAPQCKPLQPIPPGNSSIPPCSVGKATVPLPVATPVYSAPAPPKIIVPPPLIIPATKIQPEIRPPARKKVITREDMAKIFNNGTRGLTRMAAVSALKTLGFGKTAAYDALSPDGRFSAWLKCAPNGIMT